VQLSVFEFRGLPHLFDVVELPDFRAENMDDDIASINQHPVAGRQTFDPGIAEVGVLEFADQPIADGCDMAARPAGGDNHMVAQRRFACDVDGYDVFCLGVRQAVADQCKLTQSGMVAASRGLGEIAFGVSLRVFCSQSGSFPCPEQSNKRPNRQIDCGAA
jgi:hypothetical protein